MKGLALFRRTAKSERTIKLRFRLRDGRGMDLYHKSEIKAAIKELSTFEDDGELRPKVSIYNHELKEKINRKCQPLKQPIWNFVERWIKVSLQLHCLKKQSVGISIPKIT